MEPAEVERAAALCGAAGAWLVLDNTYEHFVYGAGRRHACVAAPHVINLFRRGRGWPLLGRARCCQLLPAR